MPQDDALPTIRVRVKESATNGEAEWMDLCRAVAHRSGLDIQEGHPFLVHKYAGGFTASYPPALSVQQAQELADKVGCECDEIIKAARISRALKTLEGVEQVRDSLTTTSRAVEAMQTGLATAKTGAEYADVVQKWGPTIITAWAWISPHLPSIVR